VLATAQLVIALDYSIVNVALPDVGRALGLANGTVIGGGRRPHRRRAERDPQTEQDLARQAAA
jgi:hypothetical protein